MRKLNYVEKVVIKKMATEIFERIFEKEVAEKTAGICLKAIFKQIEAAKWFQNDGIILTEHIENILGTLIINSLEFMLKEEQD